MRAQVDAVFGAVSVTALFEARACASVSVVDRDTPHMRD
jgi:hypothetical protein